MTLPWLISAALAALYGIAFAADTGHSWLRTAIKTGSVAGLAGIAAGSGAPPAIIAGLALGALGDLFLSRPGERAFLAGMAAFAAGHIAYALAFGPGLAPLWLPAGLVLLAASTEIWLAPHTGPLRWPVRAYVLVICLMAALAAARPEPLLRAGAALFVASDLLLALALFVTREPARRRLLSRLLWPAYWGGQALILLAFLPFP